MPAIRLSCAVASLLIVCGFMVTSMASRHGFCKLVFDDIEKDAVVAAGHSLWFRSFFRTYLPSTIEHVSKKKKLINGGVVGFTLQRITTESGEHRYLIDPKSLTTLHGGS
jgi:hypothetical protein